MKQCVNDYESESFIYASIRLRYFWRSFHRKPLIVSIELTIILLIFILLGHPLIMETNVHKLRIDEMRQLKNVKLVLSKAVTHWTPLPCGVTELQRKKLDWKTYAWHEENHQRHEHEHGMSPNHHIQPKYATRLSHDILESQRKLVIPNIECPVHWWTIERLSCITSLQTIRNWISCQKIMISWL